MKFGYNTNGLANHRSQDALKLIADIGYDAVAITIDHHCLDPWSPRHEEDVLRMRALLQELQLSSVIETGARYLLNSQVKHEPTLMTTNPEGRALRLDFLKGCVDIASSLGSEAVSFWSGIEHSPVNRQQSLKHLANGCQELIDYAAEKNMRLAFEPEPGMFIETFSQFEELLELVDAPHFGLTVDIGHVQCVEEKSIASCLQDWQDRIFNIHIEDMTRGVHEHLRFGDGEIDFGPVLKTLTEIEYTGCVNVELSRHSHLAPLVMQESYDFLRHTLQAIS